MSNYENEDVWSNEILESDDEETIKLKQRLNRAESELGVAKEEVKSNQSFRDDSFRSHKKEKKYSSLIANPKAKGLDRFGYDEQAHIDMKNGKGYVEGLIEDQKTRMFVYVGISVVCVALIIIKMFFL